MSQLEEIRERLDLCDKKIVSVLEERMDIIKEIMVYKKENGLPILQPEQEKRQRKMLLTHVDENTYKDEILSSRSLHPSLPVEMQGSYLDM